LFDKLVESARRVSDLAKAVRDYGPDAAISFSSPEAARVAFGLGIPHYCVSDSPHARAVCLLTIPLSHKLFTPWVIPVHAWKRYGAGPREIVRYRALDPVVWLKDYKGNPSVLEELKLDASKPIIVIRPPEEYAAYLSDIPAASNMPTDVITKVLDLDKESQVVVLPRYESQRDRFRKQFRNRVTVADHVVDAVSLLQASSVLIGGGGTMTAEAALIGTRVISYFPAQPTFVERFLISQGLVERILDPTRAARRAVSVLSDKESREMLRKKAARLLRRMEDPLRVIIQKVVRT